MLSRQAPLFSLCLLMLFCLLQLSCSGTSMRKYSAKSTAPDEKSQMPMPRADPAYLQYLERNSMLAMSSEMARVVSGSELAWRASATSGKPEALLDYADNWLFIHPLTLLSTLRSPAFSQLSGSSIWTVLREAGVRGLYVAPTQGNGALWARGRTGMDTGDDVVQYAFSQAAGKDSDYKRLMGGILDNNGLMGSDLIPAATGLGPDFFLAARNVREYPGVYCMVEIPDRYWEHLPAVESEWEGAALDKTQIASLNTAGLLPKAMRDEVSPLGKTGGWAATGKIRAVDGNIYRWVYRYYHSPEYAVLNWEDPSQTAHRILSGSAVRQVGLQGQALLGLRFEAFQGLEAIAEGSSVDAFSVEPARSAAQSMSREIRRYGGWSWVRDDDLALQDIKDFLASGVDYIHDGVFSPAAEHALLTGDATLARFMADEALRLGINTQRLIHAMPNQDGINYSLPHVARLGMGAGGKKADAFRKGIQDRMRLAAQKVSPAPVKDDYLYATAPGLAALALGAGTEEAAREKVKDIEKGHSLLVFFKAMQPGVLMLSGQDISGVLPLQWNPMLVSDKAFTVSSSSRGAYALSASTVGLAVSAQGIPRAPYLYAPPDVQAHAKDSFLGKTGLFLRARTQYGIGKSQLTAKPATSGSGSIALLSRMSDGKSYLLAVSNFSRKMVTETISLEGQPGIASVIGSVTTIATGGSHRISGKTVTITLGPWEGRALLFGKANGKTAEKTSATENITPIPVIPDMEPEKQQKTTHANAPAQEAVSVKVILPDATTGMSPASIDASSGASQTPALPNAAVSADKPVAADPMPAKKKPAPETPGTATGNNATDGTDASGQAQAAAAVMPTEPETPPVAEPVTPPTGAAPAPLPLPVQPSAPTSAATAPVPTDQNDEAGITVTVRPKRSLYSISRDYGVTVEEVMALNGMENTKITIGQKLKLPKHARLRKK